MLLGCMLETVLGPEPCAFIFVPGCLIIYVRAKDDANKIVYQIK